MSDGLDRMLCRKAAVVGERQAVNLGLDSPPSLPQELSPFTIPLDPVLVNGCLGRCSWTDHPSTNPMAVLERHWRWWPAGKIPTGKIFILDDMFSGWMAISKVDGSNSKTAGHARHPDQKLV